MLTPVNVVLNPKRCFVDVIELKILGWGNCLGLSKLALIIITRVLITRVDYKEGRRSKVEGNVMPEAGRGEAM